MTDAIVGHTGFVGGNLIAQHEFGAFFNSKNIQDIDGNDFDLLVFSGARAEKWIANKEPEKDRAGIDGAIAHLKTVRAKRLVLISTIDVLPQELGLDEDAQCVSAHAYGENRLFLEEAVVDLFDKVNIVRLPGLFGEGLKKNIVYDLLHGNMLEKINPESAFQFYDLSSLWRDIETVIAHDLPLVHLFPQPIQTGRILKELFPDAAVGSDPAPKAEYDYRTKYAHLFGGSDGFIYDADEVMRRLAIYVNGQRN